jgi:hypothetical protein
MAIGQVWKVRVIDLNMTRMEGKTVIAVPRGEYTMTQTIDGYEFSQLGKKLFALSDVEVGTSIQNKKLNFDGDYSIMAGRITSGAAKIQDIGERESHLVSDERATLDFITQYR